MLLRQPWVAPIAALFCARSVGTQTLRPQRPANEAHSVQRLYVRTLAHLGFPNGISLEGANAERTIAFRVPAHAPIDSARLRLRVRFPRPALPQSNLQVFVNGVRRAVVLRSQADSGGTLDTTIRLSGDLTATDFATITLRSSVASTADRCLDQRISLGFLEVDAVSSLAYYAAPGAITTIRQAWATLPDTVIVALPSRTLTSDEFRIAYSVGVAAMSEGRALSYTRLPALGDVTVAPAADLASGAGMIAVPQAGSNLSVYRFARGGDERIGIAIDAQHGTSAAAFLDPRWTPLTSERAVGVRAAANSPLASSNDPTFADLGLTDLERDIGADATWRLSLDLRDMPPGRVPARVELRVVTAPNTADRQLVLFVFLNGTLVRSSDISGSGKPETIDMSLPSSLLATRNELRVVMQRHRRASDACSQDDAGLPAQILSSSRVITTAANASARVFTSVATGLSSGSPLYLPAAALRDPVQYLPIVISLGRALWHATRAPSPVFFGAGEPARPSPGAAFVVVGRPPRAEIDGPVTADSGRLRIRRKDSEESVLDVSDLSAWSIVQVVRWNNHYGVQVVPASGRRRIPDWPDAYGNTSVVLADADSTLFQLNTAGRDGTLLFNDGPTLLDRLHADQLLWAALIVLLLAPALVLGVRAIVRRTPRRRLARRLDHSPPPSTA